MFNRRGSSGSKKEIKFAEEELFQYALRSLSARAITIAKLKEKLRAKAANLPDVDSALSRLKQFGYLNDRKFADSYTASRLASQGHGKARILRDLAQQQVPRIVAEQAVTDAFTDLSEDQLVEDYLRRKLRSVDLSDPKKLQSAYRRLRYAGFGSSVTIRVLKRHAAEAESLESLENEEIE